MRPIAVEMRFVKNYSPQRAVAEELLNGQKVSVPAAVLVNREQPVLFLRQLHQLGRLGKGGSEWLIDHQVTAGQQALFGELEVRSVGGGDNHQLHRVDGQQIVEATDNSRGGIGIPPFRAVALQDGCQSQSLDCRYHRSVKRTSRKSESNQADIDHGESRAKEVICSTSLKHGAGAGPDHQLANIAFAIHCVFRLGGQPGTMRKMLLAGSLLFAYLNLFGQPASPAWKRVEHLRHGINASQWFAQSRDYSPQRLRTYTTPDDIAN